MLSRPATRTARRCPTRRCATSSMTLLVAGHETTATALAWAFERLAAPPRRRTTRLRADLDAGDERYLDAVIKERCACARSCRSSAARSREPLTVGGTTLPAGRRWSRPSSSCVHRRADVYPDPTRSGPSASSTAARDLRVAPLRRRRRAAASARASRSSRCASSCARSCRHAPARRRAAVGDDHPRRHHADARERRAGRDGRAHARRHRARAARGVTSAAPVRADRDNALDGVRGPRGAVGARLPRLALPRDRPHGELHALLDQVLWQATAG